MASFITVQLLEAYHGKDPNKGYVALLGRSLNAVETAETFNRRCVVVAPDWAESYCKEHTIPCLPWNYERLN